MRALAAAAIVLACLGASHALSDAPMRAEAAFDSSFDGKQRARAKPPRGADNCRWARDRECDEPDIGTGSCALGTDYSDCRAMRQGENDSCRWARDGECDEPRFGTGACTQGTDRTDCGDIAWLRNQDDSCATSFNAVCEIAGRGDGSCAARTDRTDCTRRERPLTISDHFFGRDDRVRVNAREAPWRFVGRLTNDAGEACTATLIAADVIVTAAHCIHTERGVQAGARFEPAAGGPAARTIAYLISPRFDYQRFNSGDEIDGLDWALLRLDRPLGREHGFAGVRNLTGEGRAAARAADLYQAGYAWDTGDTLAANVRCHLAEVFADNTFTHECDTTHGDSGSALLARSDRGFDVIGVDSSFRSNPNGPFLYVAVSAASFQAVVADFVAGRTGLPVARPGKPARR